MTAKDFLTLYKKAENKILFNRQQINKAEHKAWEIYSRSYFIYSADYEDRLWKENERLVELMLDIERAIDKISDIKEKEVLRRRYIDGKSWIELADELCYSVQHIQRIHKKALERLVLPLEYKNDDRAGEKYEQLN